MKNERVYRMTFASLYPLYIQKAERKGRTREEVDAVIFWLTGYDSEGLQQQIDSGNDIETFFRAGAANEPKYLPDNRGSMRCAGRKY